MRSQDDSFSRNIEGDKAELLVVSSWRGVVRDGGSMVNWLRWWGFSSSFAYGKQEKEEGDMAAAREAGREEH
jgi:hypothetical protein